MITKEFQLFKAAVSYFTRIPVESKLNNTRALEESLKFLPIIGLLVGLTSLAIFLVSSRLWSVDVSLLLVMIFQIVVTGALHEDGLADFYDGFCGGYQKEKILAIMKDSRVGTFGALSIYITFLLKFMILRDLPVAILPLALVLAPCLSRGIAASIVSTVPYARENQTWTKTVVNSPLRGGNLFWLILLSIAPVVLFDPLLIPWILTVAILVRMLMVLWVRKKIGGYTGDCLGATQQITEVAIFLVIGAWYGLDIDPTSAGI